MRKFLNFSTILCSYVLITLLVISCGGSSGGGGGGAGSAGNGGGSVPQPEPQDTNCLLADRADKDSVVAVLCQTDSFIGVITKTTPAGQEAQQLDLLIPSTANADGTGIIWDLSKGAKIQISYDKDYTLTVDEPTEGASQLGTLSDAAEHTAEFPLQNLTIASLLNDTNEALRSGGITFSSASGSAIKVAIAPKLAVKSQADFRSMGSVVSIPDLTVADYQVPFVLENDLSLVAPGEDDAKFDGPIINEVQSAFEFDGGGNTINLNSVIDNTGGTARINPAAIIGSLIKDITLKNFILNVNKPILGNDYVAPLVGYSIASFVNKLHDIKINININISVYQGKASVLYIGGVAGQGCFDINNVVVKTVKDVAIKADVKSSISSGGLVGDLRCSNNYVHTNNNVVDVTLGFSHDNSSADFSSSVSFGGLASYMTNVSEVNNNLFNLAISRDNLPADFTFFQVAGLSTDIQRIDQVTNNLVYLDFSNLGPVKKVSGLFVAIGPHAPGYNKTANNMLFIAEGFDGSSVTEHFGAAFYSCASWVHFTDNFVSSPVTAYSNSKLASLLYNPQYNFYFTNLILDNRDAAVMVKDAGTYADNLRDRVSTANLFLFTLAEAKTTPIDAIFSAGNTSWEAVSGGYPKLKAPADFSEAKKADWDIINGLIQEGLAARAAKNQEAK